MAVKITPEYIDSLEKEHGVSPETTELRRRITPSEEFGPVEYYPEVADPSALSTKSIKDQVGQEYSVAASRGISLEEAREVIEKQSAKETLVGHVSYGALKTAIGFINIPASLTHFLEKAGRDPTFPFFAGISYLKSPEDVPTPITDFLQRPTDWLTKDIEEYIKRHPEWQGVPAESFVDLITSPRKLGYAIAESIPMLLGAGLMIATGHYTGALSIAYAAEGQDAYDEAFADTGDRDIARKARVIYGIPAAAMEFAQLTLGLKMTKELYRAALGRMALSIGNKIVKEGSEGIGKRFLMTILKENVEEWAQGTWQEHTMRMLYGKEQRGGLLGFLDRRAMESAVITPLVTATGGVGGAVGFAGKAIAAPAEAKKGAPVAKEAVEAAEVAPEAAEAVTEEKDAFTPEEEAWIGRHKEITKKALLAEQSRQAKGAELQEGEPAPEDIVDYAKSLEEGQAMGFTKDFILGLDRNTELLIGIESRQLEAELERQFREQPAPPVEEAVPTEPADISKVIATQLKEAEKVTPQVAFEKSAELKKRVAKMAGTMESLMEQGVPAEEAIRRSTGELRGELTEYELRYDPVDISPAMREAAFKSIGISEQLRALEKEGTRKALAKLLAGSYLNWSDAVFIQNHFGIELGKEARRRVPISKKWYKLLPQYLGIWRTLLTAATGDVSGIARQGLGAGLAHPVKWAKFAKEYGKAWATENMANNLHKMVIESPWLEEALSGRVKLDIIKRGPGAIEAIERGEELIGAEPIEQLPKIPVIGPAFIPIAQLTRMAERGFVEGLNYFRVSIYDGVRTAQQETLKQMSEADRAKHEHLFNSEEATNRLKSLINDATGRAWVKRTAAMRGLIPILSAAFAPRFVISRFRAPVRVAVEVTRAGKRIAMGEPLNWAELRLTAGAMAGLTALVTIVGTALVATAKMWGYDEDEVEFETDPRSVNFGRVKIRNMRFDLAGGYQTSVRIAAQMASGQAKSQAGEIYDVDRGELLLRELRKKSRPIVSLVVDSWTGRTFWGEKFGAPPKGKERDALEAIGLPENMQGVTKEFWQRTMGLAVQDLVDAYIIEGVPEGVVAGILANAGVGVQTYERWATSELIEKENRLAKTKYGKKWDELKPNEQKTLEPKLESLRVRIGQEMAVKARSKYITEEQEKVRNRMYDALSKAVKDELYKIGVTNVGGIGKKWAGDFYLNDKRYKKYEELATPLIRKSLNRLLLSSVYKRTKVPSEKRKLASKAIAAAKREARASLKKLIDQEKI